ncbi:hypothetical protein [Microbacterium laevaniformans]|uniref:hypothetical protein n=1 Tax=Microbacterium laevaniformans TaxID=36807 RepID=UPI001E351CE0
MGDGAAGRIRVGAAADLAVADRDPFVGAPEEIGFARTAWTVCAGEVIAAHTHTGAERGRAAACPACA